MPLAFEWNAAKAEVNARKHGVTFEEAATVFSNPLARIFVDPDHSSTEERELIIGHSTQERLLDGIFHGAARLPPGDKREARNTL